MNFLSLLLLKRQLQGSSSQTRREAVRKLGGLDDPQAVALLATALGDTDDFVAREAAEALARKRTPAALEALAKRVREDLVVRSIPGGASNQWRFERLVRELTEFGPAAAEPLIAVVRNRAAEVSARGKDFECSAAIAAIESLEKFADSRALPVLADRLVENGLGYEAARALAKYGPAGTDLLIARLKDPNPTVRQHVAHRLGELDDKRSAQALSELLADPDAEVRGLAASAMEKLGDSRTVDRLLPMLEDRDSKVRIRVAMTLEKLSWKPGSERESDLFHVAKGEFHWFALQGPGAIRSLVRELAAQYRFQGMAKNDDVLAMQQLQWAMRKPLEALPSRELLLPMVKALERILERDGAKAAEADLKLLSQLPDLKAQYMAEIVRENYGSGAEYTTEVRTETAVDCGRIRSLAAAGLSSNKEKSG